MLLSAMRDRLEQRLQSYPEVLKVLADLRTEAEQVKDDGAGVSLDYFPHRAAEVIKMCAAGLCGRLDVFKALVKKQKRFKKHGGLYGKLSKVELDKGIKPPRPTGPPPVVCGKTLAQWLGTGFVFSDGSKPSSSSGSGGYDAYGPDGTGSVSGVGGGYHGGRDYTPSRGGGLGRGVGRGGFRGRGGYASGGSGMGDREQSLSRDERDEVNPGRLFRFVVTQLDAQGVDYTDCCVCCLFALNKYVRGHGFHSCRWLWACYQAARRRGYDPMREVAAAPRATDRDGPRGGRRVSAAPPVADVRFPRKQAPSGSDDA